MFSFSTSNIVIHKKQRGISEKNSKHFFIELGGKTDCSLLFFSSGCKMLKTSLGQRNRNYCAEVLDVRTKHQYPEAKLGNRNEPQTCIVDNLVPLLSPTIFILCHVYLWVYEKNEDVKGPGDNLILNDFSKVAWNPLPKHWECDYDYADVLSAPFHEKGHSGTNMPCNPLDKRRCHSPVQHLQHWWGGKLNTKLPSHWLLGRWKDWFHLETSF